MFCNTTNRKFDSATRKENKMFYTICSLGECIMMLYFYRRDFIILLKKEL